MPRRRFRRQLSDQLGPPDDCFAKHACSSWDVAFNRSQRNAVRRAMDFRVMPATERTCVAHLRCDKVVIIRSSPEITSHIS